ncbi:cytochrome c oxidase subunit 3 [Nocardia vinacea]|uniref:cytochrome c oxidase subunit 3 n=1 Tax=Nocardia vinacea TaxID=96468 RepID=UPI003F4D4D17
MTNLAGTSTTEQSPDKHTTDKPARHLPGQPDMWAFVLFETLIFTAYFVVYLIARIRDQDNYLHEQAQLELGFGIFDTIVILTSSWSVARCVQSARAGRYRPALVDAVLTLSLGLVFLASKIVEWHRELRLGNGFTTSDFFSHYFFLTGIHGAHVLIGIVVMSVVIHEIRRPARRSQQLIETGATYWHTVDFLWVLIFSLLYVVR